MLGRILSIKVYARASINQRACRAVCSRQLVDGDLSLLCGLGLLLEQVHSGWVLRRGECVDLVFAPIHHVLGEGENPAPHQPHNPYRGEPKRVSGRARIRAMKVGGKGEARTND